MRAERAPRVSRPEGQPMTAGRDEWGRARRESRGSAHAEAAERAPRVSRPEGQP